MKNWNDLAAPVRNAMTKLLATDEEQWDVLTEKSQAALEMHALNVVKCTTPLTDEERKLDETKHQVANEVYKDTRAIYETMIDESCSETDKAERKTKAAEEMAKDYADKLGKYYGVEVLRFLKQLQPIEIIIIGLNCEGMSQDKIVAELRRRDSGKAKEFVGKTIRKFEGFSSGKITPEALQHSESSADVYSEDAKTGATIHTTAETDSEPPPDHTLYASDIPGTLKEWKDATPKEREEMKRYYGNQLEEAVKKQYMEATPEERQEMLTDFGDLLDIRLHVLSKAD